MYPPPPPWCHSVPVVSHQPQPVQPLTVSLDCPDVPQLAVAAVARPRPAVDLSLVTSVHRKELASALGRARPALNTLGGNASPLGGGELELPMLFPE